MKSIERRFNNLRKKEPGWSDSPCFSQAILNQQFGRQSIHRWFSKLVDKDDYASDEKRDILEGLVEATNTLRTTENEGKLPLGEFIYE